MKRIIIAVSVVLMLISLLVGCNDGNNKNVYEQITPAQAKALMDTSFSTCEPPRSLRRGILRGLSSFPIMRSERKLKAY